MKLTTYYIVLITLLICNFSYAEEFGKIEKKIFKAEILEAPIIAIGFTETEYKYVYSSFTERGSTDKFAVGFLPKWLVKIKVKEVKEANNILRDNEILNLIIHSPVRILGGLGNEIIGNIIWLELVIKHSGKELILLDLKRNIINE